MPDVHEHDTQTALTVLVVGATGSVGRFVVAEALRRGYRTRALIRRANDAADLAEGAEPTVGDLTDAQTLSNAVNGVDAVVFTHGSHGGAAEAEQVDYGAVRNVLAALGACQARIALMTAIGTSRSPRRFQSWPGVCFVTSRTNMVQLTLSTIATTCRWPTNRSRCSTIWQQCGDTLRAGEARSDRPSGRPVRKRYG